MSSTPSALVSTNASRAEFAALLEKAFGNFEESTHDQLAVGISGDDTLWVDAYRNDYLDENGVELSKADFELVIHGDVAEALRRIDSLGWPWILWDGYVVDVSAKAA